MTESQAKHFGDFYNKLNDLDDQDFYEHTTWDIDNDDEWCNDDDLPAED